MADEDGEVRSGAGVSGDGGQAGSGLAADAAGTSQQQQENHRHNQEKQQQEQQQQQQQQQQQGLSSTYNEAYWSATFVTGNVLHRLREDQRPGSSSSDAVGSPPPGLCTALQQALSGPCTQHLTLALGTLMLHEADGGSLYGMPLPYRTGHVADALARLSQDGVLSGGSAQPLRLLGRSVYGNLFRLLTSSGHGPPPTLPAVPPEGHVDLLLRLGRLAVRSAQVYLGQACSMGPRVAVIKPEDLPSMALFSLLTARQILSSRVGKPPAAAMGSPPAAVGAASGVGAGEGGGPAASGSGAAGGAVGAAGGGEGMGGAGTEGTGTDTNAAALSGRPEGRRDAVEATARRRAARAAVAAETRWHRLLLDTGLWVAMEAQEVAVWVEAWSHFESLGQLGSDTGA